MIESPLVGTDWLYKNLNNSNVIILEATVFLESSSEGPKITSGEEAYKKSHIPRALFADLLKDFSDPDAPYPFTALPHKDFVRKARTFGVNNSSTVVIYDRGSSAGNEIHASDWASRLWWQFRLSGHEKVYVLAGGWKKWEEEKKPVTAESHLPDVTGTFQGAYRSELYATEEDVELAMTDSSTLLMNCLSKADFHGRTDNYPRKGHIPGSENVFFGDVSSRESGSLPSSETLWQIFDRTGALDPGKKVITYCGGGIAATWNALVLASLGRKEVAVYDGSLLEWMDQPDNPLEK